MVSKRSLIVGASCFVLVVAAFSLWRLNSPYSIEHFSNLPVPRLQQFLRERGQPSKYSEKSELSRAAFNAQHLPAVNPSSHRDDWDSNFSRPFNYLTDKQLVSFFKSNPDLSVSLDDARLVRFAFEHQRLVRGLVLPLLFDQRATMIFARLHSYSDIHIDPALDRLIHVIDDAPWASYLIRLVIAPSHSIYEAVSEISSASSFDEWIQFVFMFLSFLEGLQCCAFIYDFVVFRKVRSFESLKFFMQLRDGAIHQFISRPLIVAVSSLASYYILWPLVPAPWLLLASNALLFNLPAWYLFQTYSSLMRSVHALRILKEGYAETQKQELIDILKSKQIQIHRVSFKKRLGQGGFGQVYAASIFGTDVAVKFMNRQIDLPLTKMEISILRQLNHPNIVGILGTIGGAGNGSSASSLVLGDTCFFPGLVLEFADMGDLWSFYSNAYHIAFEDVFSFAVQLAQGLEYLHSENIVHNDIKPPNILLFKRGARIIVKYSDFGVSGRGIGARAHSIKWCAPEDEDPQQFRGHNAPKDVFTFGLLMYFLYTGNMDVDHSSPKHLPNRSFKADTTHPAPPSQDFNCYQSVMNQCLQRDPKDRPSMFSVKAALETKTHVSSANSAILQVPETAPSPSQSFVRLFNGLFSPAAGLKSESGAKGPKAKVK